MSTYKQEFNAAQGIAGKRRPSLFSANIHRPHSLKITKQKTRDFLNCEGNFVPEFLKNVWKEGLNTYWQVKERKYCYNIMKHQKVKKQIQKALLQWYKTL